MNLPFLIFSDTKGRIYSHPYLRMAVASLNVFVLPKKEELIVLPKGSSIFYLPGRLPVGFNPETKLFESFDSYEGKSVFAAAAFLIPAFLRLHLPAAKAHKEQVLPLWAYAACGFKNNNFYVAGKRIDVRVRQSPRFYNNKIVADKVRLFLKKYPDNRLFKHLANCSLNYNCLAAKNLFLERWEAPLPTARFCNARCLGCLSYQDIECLSSHKRINFKPDANEIAQVATHHLEVAREAIVSFGQGCEGEPILEADVIAKAISLIRNKTKRGTINMNTNASLPDKIELLCKAGMDSFRVSLNSPIEELYNLYFRPNGYKFRDVIRSIHIAKRYKKFVSLNLFMFPGFSDSKCQKQALIKLIKDTGIDMLQCRNFNIDPLFYLNKLQPGNLKPTGILRLIEALRGQLPKLKIGYFNLPKESFTDFKNVVK